MFSTRLTQRLGIPHPVLLAGLGGVGRAALVAAVSNAGGLGTLGMIAMAPDFIRDQIRKTRALTARPFGVNLVPPVAPGPGGIEAQFAVCLEERVPVLSLFWCDDPAPFVSRCHAAGITVMLQVGSAEEARRAVAAGADVVIAQGVEAGGHVRGTVGLLPLLASVREAVDVPVVASGGIVDGRGLAATLAAGGDGVWVGTRFVASEESEAHPDYKKRLCLAAETDTVYTELFHRGWPPHAPHRVLKNALTEGGEPPAGAVAHVRLPDRVMEVPAFASPTPTIHTEGQTDLMPNYAGQGVGLIHEVLPAARIVERMVAEAEAIVRDRLPRLLA